jgi:hypothetical protein
MGVARIRMRGEPLQNFNLLDYVEQPGRFSGYSTLVVDNPPFHFLMPCNSGGIPGFGVQWCQITTPLYGTISFDIGGETHSCLLYVDTGYAFIIFDPSHPSW